MGRYYMISGEFRLKNYGNWHVSYFMMTDAEDADIIIDELYCVEASDKFIRRAEKILYSNSINKGITYSNPNCRQSVVVVSKTTSIFEFLNSFAHEIDHVEKHISKKLRFNPYSEDASYLVGEIVMGMIYDIVKNYIDYVGAYRIR